MQASTPALSLSQLLVASKLRLQDVRIFTNDLIQNKKAV